MRGEDHSHAFLAELLRMLESQGWWSTRRKL